MHGDEKLAGIQSKQLIKNIFHVNGIAMVLFGMFGLIFTDQMNEFINLGDFTKIFSGILFAIGILEILLINIWLGKNTK